jgi:hypothetical protein
MAGCVVAPQSVYLRKSPSGKFFENMETKSSKDVSYTFESKEPDPFQFNKINIDLNESYASNLKHYMNNKYSIVQDQGDSNVDFILQSCKVEVRNAGADVIYGSSGYSAAIYNITVSTELNVKVAVNANGNISEKEIITLGEYTGNSSDLTTGQMSFNLAIEKSILLIDRFLDKAFAE